jgi:hypothetical protein
VATLRRRHVHTGGQLSTRQARAISVNNSLAGKKLLWRVQKKK